MNPNHRKKTYPLYGALLAAGSPAGYLFLKSILLRTLPTPSWIVAELQSNSFTYLYMGLSTLVVFLLLGGILGHKEDILAADSLTDPLTGLWNRRLADVRINEEIRRSQRHRTPLALLLVDVDHLKTINDNRGHKAGDIALQTICNTLRETCRNTDFVARIGGDEILILAPSTTAPEAVALGNRFRQALALRNHTLTVSIGVADLADLFPINRNTLFDAADKALYQAKKAGRDRVMIASNGRPVSSKPSRSRTALRKIT